MIDVAPSNREEVACYYCGSDRRRPLLVAEDDLTGRPGRFSFVVCEECGFASQSPRIDAEGIKAYYDDEYIAHRKKRDWGALGGFVERALDRLDRKKVEIASRYVDLNTESEVLDVGYEGPGVPRQTIPATALYHEVTAGP